MICVLLLLLLKFPQILKKKNSIDLKKKRQITDLQGSNPSRRGSLRLNVSCEEKRKIKEVSLVHCFLV